MNKDSEVYKILSQRFLGLESENQQVNFRTIIETDCGFSIDTDDFVYIEDNEHHSYTFQIVKDSLANLENLVLNYNLESENYDAYLIEYLIDEEDEENIINHEEINDFISKTRISYLPEFNSNSLLQQRSFFAYISTCTYTVTYEQEIIFTGYQYGGGGVYETISTPIYTLVSCTYDFVGDGGSSGAPVYQIEEGNGRNNGGGGGGPQNPNNPSVGDNNSGSTNNGGVGFGDGNGNIVTTPVKNLTITTSTSLFFNALNSAQNANLKMWWNVPDNYVASNFIMAYLNANNTIPQNMQNASTFAINLINYCVINQFYGSEAQSFFISQVLQQSLTSSQQSWWNNPNNTEAVAQIIGYLGQNGLNPIYNNNTPRTFNTESWEFAREVIEISLILDINAMEVWNNQQDYKSRMSQAELAIFEGLNKPQQIKYLASACKASERAEVLFPTNIDLHNGKGDAFRHTLWNALSAMFIGYELTQQLTTAHEDVEFTYPNQWKEKSMDLHNNEKGLLISQYSNVSDVEDIILFELNVMGNLMYLTPVGYEHNGTYHLTWANYSSVLTPTNQ